MSTRKRSLLVELIALRSAGKAGSTSAVLFPLVAEGATFGGESGHQQRRNS
jgi:hypothetical protein